MKTRGIGAAFPCALLVSAALTAPAWADANIAPPAEKFAVSPGGVDMRSGRYVYDQTDLSIGGEGGALSLSRTLAQPVAGHANPFANFSHNWDVLISEKRVIIQQNLFTHGIGNPDYQIEVTFGGLSQTFRGHGSHTGFDLTSRSGYARLTYAGDRATSAVYTFQATDGTIAMFRAINSADCSTALRCAYVSQIIRPDGETLSFEYDNQGGNATRLRSVTSSRGYALLLEYSGNLVAKACTLNLAFTAKPGNNFCPGGALATATYTYDGAGGETRLASVVDPSNAIWGFVNGPYSIGFVRPGDTSPWLTNTFFNRGNDDGLVEQVMSTQAFADGTSYSYGFDETPLVIGHVSQIAGGSFTDGQGNATIVRYGFPVTPHAPSQGYGYIPADGGESPVFVYQVTPGPVEVIDPLGRTTITDYCDPNAMANLPANWHHRCSVSPAAVSTTDPEGIRTELSWDFVMRNLHQARQIARPGTLQPNGQPWPNIVRSATYNCLPANFRFCSKPVTVTDARSAVTDFTYSPDHGGLLTETGPAPAGGAPRPQTRHEYALRHAWISNGAGGYVQAAAPIWVRTSTSICRTSAATGSPCAAAGDEVRTTYLYGPDSGPNNLLLRGQEVSATDGGVTTILRTCYTYDQRGRRISETQPEANPASCS